MSLDGRRIFIEPFFPPEPLSEEDTRRIDAALEALYKVRMGYSDRHLDRQATIPEVFEVAHPLIRSTDDFVLLCEKTPAILKSLPEESIETPVGYNHTYDLSELRKRAGSTQTMEEFLSGVGDE